MKKIIIVLMTLSIVLTICKVSVIKAEDHKVEIWSYALDERIEHRSIKVGGSNNTFGIMKYPSTLKLSSVSWSSDNSSIARIEGNNESATVYGVKEGCTKVRLTVHTTSGETLTHSSVISIYTPATDATGYVSSKATFYRGADSNSWIRSENVPVGQRASVLGSCGNYLYLSMPDDYEFDDGRSARTTYALKSKMHVNVNSIDISESSLSLEKNNSRNLTTSVTPSIATNKKVNYSSSNTNVATVDSNGKVTGKNEGYIKIMGRSESEGRTDSCNFSFYSKLNDVEANLSDNAKLYFGADASERVRSANAPKEQSLTVVGSCASYYRVKLPSNYTFDDGNSDRYAYVLKSKVYVPVKQIILDKKDLILGEKETVQIKATVLPEIATDKTLTWQPSKLQVVNVDKNGKVSSAGSGSTKIVVKATNGVSADCSITVLKGLKVANLGDFKLYKVGTNWGTNTVRYTRCHGANFYALYVGTKRKDGTYSWENIYESYGRHDNGNTVDDDFADIGTTYYYKVVAKNYLLNEDYDFVEFRSKTSNIVKIKNGEMSLKASLSGKKKVKLSWNKIYKEDAKKRGYVVYRKAKGKKKFSSIKTINSIKTLSFTDKDTKKKTTYEYKVRAFYKNDKGKKEYSPYSNVCKIKTKK